VQDSESLHYDELANSITHGVGLLLATVGVLALIVLASLHGSTRHIVTCSIYGSTLVFMYAASTLYHSVQLPRAKHVLRIIDHSAIYLLIAGTYTPFTLVQIRGGWGWTLFGLVWGLTVVGIAWKALFIRRFAIVSGIIYVLMGWMVVIAAKPLLQRVPPGAIAWLVAGGVAYTAGLVFFASKRIPHHHAIWHVFVLVGSICHYVAVLLYVVPRH
jgi:hemolysin III